MVKLLKIELETKFFFLKCSEFNADSKNHTFKAVECIFIGEMEIRCYVTIVLRSKWSNCLKLS